MTCREALVAMLGADPWELTGTGDSPMARHIAGCARCAAVAARLASESRLLGSWVAGRGSSVAARGSGVVGRGSRESAPRRRAAWRPGGAFAGTLALAAMVLLGVVMRRPENRAVASVERSPAPIAGAGPSAPPVAVEDSSPLRGAPRRTRASAHAVVTRASIPVSRFPIPDQSKPVPIRARPIAAMNHMATVAVEPSAGQRAAVIRTSNPSVTVVWLY